MAMFTRQRDVSLIRKFNRELMGNIITQQCAIYQFKLEETKVNIYGEGIQFNQPIEFYFFRDDLVDAKVVPEVGDIILYQEGYYGVQSTVANQYWGGKNPSYPNNDSNGEPNPLNPDLDQFGNNLSILVSTYYIPSDKVAISPYVERF
mgnify:CR=1 FL=1